MNLNQFLLALRGRFWVFAILAGTTALAALLVTLVLPKQYESTVSLLLDYRDEQSLSGTVPSARNASACLDPAEMATTSLRPDGGSMRASICSQPKPSLTSPQRTTVPSSRSASP